MFLRVDHETKRNNTLFSEMWVTRKIFIREAANLFFFNRFSVDILISSLVSFVFFILFFVSLFFELKNVYSDTHSTMRAGE